MVAKPDTTSGPPRAVKSCIFLGPQLPLRERKRQDLYVCKRLWGRAVERNAASPDQHLGGREQALGGLQVPFQANSSRKPTHPARPKSSPNYPCSNTSCYPFCLNFFFFGQPASLHLMLQLAFQAILQHIFIGHLLYGFSGEASPDLEPGSGSSSVLPPSSGFPHEGTHLVL